MSKYLLDKFLFTVDRDPALVERYREDPRGTVEWWEAEEANRILARNPGVIASFSRALTEGLTAQQSDEAFNKALGDAIESIYRASAS